jgi:hypothetical protein
VEASETTASLIEIIPESGRSNPAMQRKTVVLPLPDGPTMTAICPDSTENETESATRTPSKDFVTDSTLSVVFTVSPE